MSLTVPIIDTAGACDLKLRRTGGASFYISMDKDWTGFVLDVRVYKSRSTGDIAAPLINLTIGGGLTLATLDDGSDAVLVEFTSAQLGNIADAYVDQFIPWEFAETASGGQRQVRLVGMAVIQ